MSPRPLANEIPSTWGNGIGKTVPRGWYTRNQAAKLVGKSTDTLRRWDVKGIYRPSGKLPAGQLMVSVYNDRDIKAMKKIINTGHKH